MNNEDGTCADLRTQLFDNLLSDKHFIEARFNSLCRTNLSVGTGHQTKSRRSAILIPCKHELNFVVSTSQHTNDIEWCSSLVGACKKLSNDIMLTQQIDELTLSSCLDAISEWQDELITSYNMLRASGKLTIYYHTNEPELISQTTNEKNEQGKSAHEGENIVKVAESLLMKNDAWTMDDNSATLFKIDCSMKFQPPRPPWKGHRKKETADASPLARILNIDMHTLRSAVSIGRSLLDLSEFSRIMLDKYMSSKELKDFGSVKLQVQMMQCSCLQHAIEALSCSATTMTYILSNALADLDEDDLDETVKSPWGPTALLQRLVASREDSKLLLYVAGILSADAWYSLGRLLSKLSEAGGSDIVSSIFDRSLLVLNFPKSISLKNHTMEILCKSLLSPLARYRCFLHSNVSHSMGVYLYEQGDIQRADEYLNNAVRSRRQMLDHLRRQDCKVSDNIDSCISEMFESVVGGMNNSTLITSASMTEDAFQVVWKNSISGACALMPKTTFTVDELESDLSMTLEYSALAQHAKQKYQSALALFQESVVFRNSHVGKHSLDVASLHFNMGVVYDDLEQYDQAINVYGESLRIRLIQRNKATSAKIISELEESLIMT